MMLLLQMPQSSLMLILDFISVCILQPLMHAIIVVIVVIVP